MVNNNILVEVAPSRNPDPSTETAHHTANGFTNPWPSFRPAGLLAVFKARFGQNDEKNFVPVPTAPDGSRSDALVKIVQPDWAAHELLKLRATWLGHASFLVETPVAKGSSRGIRLLFDPLFSERTSPVSFIGPKRYTPTPCTIADLPEIDAIVISHNHYDHLDYQTLLELHRLHPNTYYFVPLGNDAWLTTNLSISPSQISALDWWQARTLTLSLPTPTTLTLTCTPSQHTSGRTPFDRDRTLWSSWLLTTPEPKTLFFGGDTAYQALHAPSPCPIFAQIGKISSSSPIDLALLPIGLMTPESFMSNVHCTPEKAYEIHEAIGARISVGMHYGTVRGGISAQYEDVRDPPRRWKAVGVREGKWLGGGVGTEKGENDGLDVQREGGGIGLCHVGETVAV